MNEEATERGRLRDMLLDGVVAPPDAEDMFDRTFSGAGDDGVHLLPPTDLFDEAADVVPEPFEDPTTDDGYPEFAVDATEDAAHWSEPVPAADSTADAVDPGVDPGDPGAW